MLFITGIKYFELQTFSFKELNISPIDETNKYTIEVVEMYFHLINIPIFSLGKRIKLGFHGDLLNLPTELKEKIDSKIINARSKWYSFTGIYITVIAFALFFLDQKLEANRLQDLFLKKKQEQLSYLEKPQIGDLYFFVSGEKDIRAEVHLVSNDSILITVQKSFQYQKSGGQRKISKSDQELMQELINRQERLNLLNDSLQEYHPNEKMLCSLLAQRLIGENIFFVQFWISKFDLKKSFCPENNCNGVFIKNSVKEFYNPTRLIEVERQTQKLN